MKSAEARISLPPAQLTQLFAGVRDIERAQRWPSTPQRFRSARVPLQRRTVREPINRSVEEPQDPITGHPGDPRRQLARPGRTRALTVVRGQNEIPGDPAHRRALRKHLRTYVTEEAPQELDRAIIFLVGSPQRVEEDWLWRPGPAPRRSRRADRSAEGLDHIRPPAGQQTADLGPTRPIQPALARRSQRGDTSPSVATYLSKAKSWRRARTPFSLSRPKPNGLSSSTGYQACGGIFTTTPNSMRCGQSSRKRPSIRSG